MGRNSLYVNKLYSQQILIINNNFKYNIIIYKHLSAATARLARLAARLGLAFVCAFLNAGAAAFATFHGFTSGSSTSHYN